MALAAELCVCLCSCLVPHAWLVGRVPSAASLSQYKHEVGSLQEKLSGLTREELQRALGVKPMDKSSRYRGVSKKKGRWEAKVMLNRKWAYRWAANSSTGCQQTAPAVSRSHGW